ncbi:hypothetical protein EYZ11_012630 [Aspergillus tanneri]|uniref:Uncharacterized protein n=1 Tax=Aspergillus tanneri TaxID=1220188 RepID=A0A4V3UMN1_9EURO|nr:hypothetical protein EYZ11_012630 [Aspergillus tanneri]
MTFGNIRFQSAEHERIGDNVWLKYPEEKIMSGKEFAYPVDKTVLSYGLICALAGDFYGNCKVIGDAEQISDNWDADEKRSIDLFLANTKRLATNTGGYLRSILEHMKGQTQEVVAAEQIGKDPAQAYSECSYKYDLLYFWCTNWDYVLLALSNFDHFGEDAVKAYKAGHKAALRQARAAGRESDTKKKIKALTESYFLEAFAAHFLTDLFSAGHMRTPRRILHKTYTGSTKAEEPTMEHERFVFPKPWPADLCAQAMHDEDCANGLWVTNKLGEQWAAYGDGQLFSPKNNTGYERALAAVQKGADEIWSAFDTRDTKDCFGALDMIPFLDEANAFSNFAPLFKVDPADKTKVLFRKDLDSRGQASFTTLNTANVSWRQILNQIEESGPCKNQRPLSLPLMTPSSLLQLRFCGDFGKFIIAKYGPVFSKAPDREDRVESWNMLSQHNVSLRNKNLETNWTSVERIDDTVYALSGLGHNNYHHVGIEIHSDGTRTPRLLWDVLMESSGSALPMLTCYGEFSLDGQTTMVTYWCAESRHVLEVRPLSGDTGPTPVPSTVLALDGQLYNSATVWNFITWPNGYQNSPQRKTHLESGRVRPAQKILPLNVRSVQLDVLEVHLESNDPYVQYKFTRDYSLSWHQANSTIDFPEQYLTWLLADINGNGRPDLVSLVNAGMGLGVVVFPGLDEFAFGSPQTSVISSDKGRLFNASFMKPVYAAQARYRFSAEPRTCVSDGAILQVFDNYGILGIRLVAPLVPQGSYAYEAKGQTPAVAGQLSCGLGTKPGSSFETLGFFIM